MELGWQLQPFFNQLGNYEAHSPTWYALRALLTDASGSNLGGMLGLGPTSRPQLWKELKTGERKERPPFLDAILERGNWAEKAVPEILRDGEYEGKPLPQDIQYGCGVKLWMDEKGIIYGVTADGLAPDAVVEIKYSSTGVPYPRPKLLHLPQVLSEMKAWDEYWAWYMNVFESESDCGIVIWRVGYSPKAWDMVTHGVEEFLSYDKVPPRMKPGVKKQRLDILEGVHTEEWGRVYLGRPLPGAPPVPAIISQRFEPSIQRASADELFGDHGEAVVYSLTV
jgi:hypothetical protein